MEYDDVFETLLRVGKKYGFRPDVPLEAEDFFRNLLSDYSGSTDGFVTWLEEQAIKFFRSFVKPPHWIQDPEWPYFEGRPMQFVGQVDLLKGSTPFLNHSASYFVFVDFDTGISKVVVQAD